MADELADKDTELSSDDIANVAALIGLVQGQLSPAHFPQDVLAEIQDMGVLEEDYVENVIALFKHVNPALGTQIFISVFQALLGCRILEFNSERFEEFFEPTEGSYLQ